MNKLKKSLIRLVLGATISYSAYNAGVYYSTRFLLEHDKAPLKTARQISRDVNTPKEYLCLYFAKKAADDYIQQHKKI